MISRPAFLVAISLCAGLPLLSQETRPVLDRLRELETAGRLTEAQAAGRAWLAEAPAGEGAPALARRAVDDEVERLRRLTIEYALTRDALIAQLSKALRDFTAAEFDRFDHDGWFDRLTIDGAPRYANASRSNLFFRHPELATRRVKTDPDTLKDVVLAHIDAVERAAHENGRREVLPVDYAVDMTITVAPDAVPAGKPVRCWMPLPRALPHQSPGVPGTTEPKPAAIDPPDAPVRSIYFERAAVRGEPTTFHAQYRFAASAVAPFAKQSTPPPPLSEADRARFTAESAPHVTFSPAVRRLAAEVGAGTASPRELARRFYDWVGDHVKYSFAVEYSTTPCIPQKVLDRGYGDCGEEALLFITLCRLNGIPARWQSGWAAFPGNETMHDWAEIWLPGEGWCPVDPYMAVYAATLPAAPRQKIRDFYFGGLDHWRLIANSDHGTELSPRKPSLRSDPVDFQRGEVECEGRNVYFDQFKYAMKITPIGP